MGGSRDNFCNHGYMLGFLSLAKQKAPTLKTYTCVFISFYE